MNSYVGNSLEAWLTQYPEDYEVDKISVRDDKWKEHDFSEYDSIIHVAGIAHVSRNPKMEELYYKVNRDLTIEIAKKAKQENVPQFIFLSSIIVYGESIKNNGMITRDTVPEPSNFYGRSKLEAEKGLEVLQDSQFQVAIIRPPMIYGKGSKGNYPKLAKLARTSPIFPNIENQRSMLHIDNLSEFIRLLISNNDRGLFFPQNKEYVQTSKLVEQIAKVHGKKVYLTKIANPLINIFKNKQGMINKLFGNLIYEQSISIYIDDYQINNFKKTIECTEINSRND